MTTLAADSEVHPTSLPEGDLDLTVTLSSPHGFLWKKSVIQLLC
jgi:hypothetical protein